MESFYKNIKKVNGGNFKYTKMNCLLENIFSQKFILDPVKSKKGYFKKNLEKHF